MLVHTGVVILICLCFVRAIHCPHDCCNFKAGDLNPFTKVSHIRLDMAGPQEPSYFSIDVDKVIDYIPGTIRHLEIRGLTWPEPLVMQRISCAVPDLQTLNLRQPMIWCGLCNTCSISSFKLPYPEKIIYEKGVGLPVNNVLTIETPGISPLYQPHYAKYLASLEHLHTVRLTVAVEEGQHAILDSDNTNLWEGECEMCIERLYCDEEFRNEWLEKKRKAEPRPPALARVEWVLLECTKKHWSEFTDAWPGEILNIL